MKIYTLSELDSEQIRSICTRNPVFDAGLIETCRDIFEDVGRRGDAAVRHYTRRFDGVEMEDFRVDGAEYTKAVERIPKEILEAFEKVAANIRKFHSSQNLVEAPVEIDRGITCWRASRPIHSVGLYVPGGTAVLPSTVLMLGIPARLAGCRRIVLCVPPRPDGSVSPEVIGAAQIAGIRQVFKIGGAQAVAALALGTETVPRVEKILGPGNRYVQTAKLLATYHGASIDMIAGPSEVLVIADSEAPADVIAADLISQAEHGPDSQSVLVTDSAELVSRVLEELETQLADLPRREMAEESLKASFALLVDSLDEAFEFSNQYAPEHLILSLRTPKDWLGKIQSAGSVFVGPWSPEVAGDYASGTNHTLPTSGSARSVSGVSMDTYVKKITFQELTAEGLSALSPVLQTMADVELLEGHARAVRKRLESTRPGKG